MVDLYAVDALSVTDAQLCKAAHLSSSYRCALAEKDAGFAPLSIASFSLPSYLRT